MKLHVISYILGLLIGYFLWREKPKCAHCGNRKTEICLPCYEELLAKNIQLKVKNSKYYKPEKMSESDNHIPHID